jgi:hypothetical protein
LFRREWLWEVAAPGEYLLRCFALGTAGQIELGAPRPWRHTSGCGQRGAPSGPRWQDQV